MGRTTTPKTEPTSNMLDPLADLREPDEPGLIPTAPADPDVAEEPVFEVRPMVTKATQEDMVAEAVAAFHRDPTTQGFLHGGGQCGCRYVARVALQAAVPVMTEEDWYGRRRYPNG